MEPVVEGFTDMVKVAVAPLGIVPRLQVKLFPLGEQSPCVVVTETNARLAGSESVTMTLVAVIAPLFLITLV